MKRILLLLVALLPITVIHGRDNFYYCCDEKVFMEHVPNRMVVVTTPDTRSDFLASHGLKFLERICDGGKCFNVYQSDKTYEDILHKVLKSKDAGTVKLFPCYKTIRGKMHVYYDGRIRVYFINENDTLKLKDLADTYGCRILPKSEHPVASQVLLDPGMSDYRDAIDLANRMNEAGIIKYVDPNGYCQAEPDDGVNTYQKPRRSRRESSNGYYMLTYDPDSEFQWGLCNHEDLTKDCNVSGAWNYASGKSTKIAIIDRYIDYSHDDLQANIDSLSIPPFSKNPSPYGKSDHGTHCAGIAAAIRHNDKCISGVAPDAKLLCISIDTLNNAIDYAWRNKAQIISISAKLNKFGPHRAAIQNALKQGRDGWGCVIVKSAGNAADEGGDDNITFPGSEPGVITVAAFDSDGRRDADSSYGDNMFISAPGVGIVSTVPGNGVGFNDGTSMAAPFVAGVAALMLEKNPYLPLDSIKAIMGRTALKVDSVRYEYKITPGKPYGTWNKYLGYGAIDAARCLKETPRASRFIIVQSKREDE